MGLFLPGDLQLHLGTGVPGVVWLYVCLMLLPVPLNPSPGLTPRATIRTHCLHRGSTRRALSSMVGK